MTRESNALDLESGVFTLSEPRKIAESLKRAAHDTYSVLFVVTFEDNATFSATSEVIAG